MTPKRPGRLKFAGMDPLYIIGTGNVGSHLARRFLQRGLVPAGVLGRNRKPEHRLWEAEGIPVLDNPAMLPEKCILILAVPDDAIAPLAQSLAKPNRLLIHTSGSVGMEELGGGLAGVLYPLQSFHADQTPAWESIPLFLEWKEEADASILQHLAGLLGGPAQALTSDQRRKLHLAAVFANNFPTHLAALANQYLQSNNLNFKWLMPLIQQTLERLATHDPEHIQTGPARRGDGKTVAKHLDMLAENPEVATLYRQISQSIAKHYGKEL